MKLRVNVTLFSLAVLIGVARIDAQVNWVQASAPSPRCCMGMASAATGESSPAYTLLFGGVQGYYSTLGDTWKLEQGGWFQIFPPNSPSPREGPGMAFDAATGTVVLFGGSSGLFGGTCCALNDTWIWDGTTWTQVFPPVSPPARRFDIQGMAYDAENENVVLFGGVVEGNTVLGDTWTWNGKTKTWTQHFPANSPSPRRAPIAYDDAHETLVLFGGDNVTSVFGDTWIWNGTNWYQRHPAAAPPARGSAAMAYDRDLKRIVLFGGNTGIVGYSDTWTWDGAAWSQVNSATVPPDRYSFGLGYDPLAHGLVMFGGFSACCGIQGDTWKLSLAP